MLKCCSVRSHCDHDQLSTYYILNSHETFCSVKVVVHCGTVLVGGTASHFLASRSDNAECNVNICSFQSMIFESFFSHT